MNIKEIIDAERWERISDIYYREHNNSLDSIEEAITEIISKLELELQRYKQAPNLPHISGGSCNTTHYACDCVLKRIAELEETINQLGKSDASLCAQNEAQGRNAVIGAKRIAELEAQVPKVVKPKFLVEIGVHHCRCYTQVKLEYSYCPDCGAKLDWTEESK